MIAPTTAKSCATPSTLEPMSTRRDATPPKKSPEPKHAATPSPSKTATSGEPTDARCGPGAGGTRHARLEPWNASISPSTSATRSAPGNFCGRRRPWWSTATPCATDRSCSSAFRRRVLPPLLRPAPARVHRIQPGRVPHTRRARLRVLRPSRSRRQRRADDTLDFEAVRRANTATGREVVRQLTAGEVLVGLGPIAPARDSGCGAVVRRVRAHDRRGGRPVLRRRRHARLERHRDHPAVVARHRHRRPRRARRRHGAPDARGVPPRRRAGRVSCCSTVTREGSMGSPEPSGTATSPAGRWSRSRPTRPWHGRRRERRHHGSGVRRLR